jgi:hypothetical protein
MRRADNIAPICELIVWAMWDPRYFGDRLNKEITYSSSNILCAPGTFVVFCTARTTRGAMHTMPLRKVIAAQSSAGACHLNMTYVCGQKQGTTTCACNPRDTQWPLNVARGDAIPK